MLARARVDSLYKKMGCQCATNKDNDENPDYFLAPQSQPLPQLDSLLLFIGQFFAGLPK
jgi:hypothetical protein